MNIVSLSFFLWHLLILTWSHHFSILFLSLMLWCFSFLLLWELKSLRFKILSLFWKNRAWDHWKIVNLLNWTFISHTVHLMILQFLLLEIKLIIMLSYFLFMWSCSGDSGAFNCKLLWFLCWLLSLRSKHIKMFLFNLLIVIKRDEFIKLPGRLSFGFFGSIDRTVTDVLNFSFILCWFCLILCWFYLILLN